MVYQIVYLSILILPAKNALHWTTWLFVYSEASSWEKSTEQNVIKIQFLVSELSINLLRLSEVLNTM